jgi:cobalamin transport system substrate-binding protein
VLTKVFTICLTGLLFLMAGCGKPPLEETTKPKAIPQRIICMAPSATEAVFALGAGDRVVGVDTYSTYPPETAKVKKVGGLTDPDIEGILALKPDLIIVWQKHAKVEELAKEFDIPLMSVQMTSVDEICTGLEDLGRILGTPEKGDALSKKIRADLEKTRQRVAEHPRHKVLFLAGRRLGNMKGLWAAGNKSFLTELTAIAGGDNIYSDMDATFREVSLESIVARAPEAIIEPHPTTANVDETRAASLKEWQTLPDIPAVVNNRLLILINRGSLLPGPRIAETAARIADLLHPETRDAPATP